MMKRRHILLLAATLCGTLITSAQGFFNLTAEQVRIDSLLPYFTYTHDLGYNYADSVYEATIEYPEFVPMTDTDIRRYNRITSDSLPEMPVVKSYVAVARKRGQLDLSFVPLVCRDGRMMKLVSFKLNIKASPRPTITKSASKSGGTPAERYADNSVLRSGQWAKIRVPNSGVYQITDALISRAGFSNPSKVKIYGYGGALQPEILTGDYLTATDDLCEVPTCLVNGKRLFYAQGPVTWSNANDRIRNPYSDYGYYFLTENDGEPLTIDEQTFTDSFYPSADFMNSLYEIDDFAWYHSGRNLYDARAFSFGMSRDYTIASAGASADGTVTVAYTADSQSEATISINDSVVGTVNVNKPSSEHNAANTGRAVFRVNNLKASNKITINHTGGGTAHLDYIVVHNNKPAAAPDFNVASFPVPEYVYRITNQNHHADTPTDMIILLPTTQKLKAQAEQLKELRETKDGLSVRIVPVDELYNEFSSGTPDATAYRRYLKMFYDRAETDDDIPKFLVLFGDGSWDNRMHLADWRGYSPDNFLLCFESENSMSATDSYVSDDFFCMLDDGERMETYNSYKGKADVAVGRIPARTEEEAQTVIDKLVDYASNRYAGSWQNTIVFMGDDGDNNSHMLTANKVADDVATRFPMFDIRKIMWDTYQRQASATGFSYPDVENLVKQYMTNGALIMNYSGHGAPTTISHELVLVLNDFKNTVSNNLSLWITASCDIMPFDSQSENIGETALFNKNGGAIAFFGTTRTVYAHRNEPMNLAFMREVLKMTDGKPVPIGEAVRITKNKLVDSKVDIINNDGTKGTTGDESSNKLHYVLLGDPSLRLAIPTLDIVIDSINGTEVTDGTGNIQLKAGTPVVVKGHVEDKDMKQTDFNGLVTATVRDAEELITGRQNDPTTEVPITFFERQSTIYKGTDSIRSGEFTFNFIVPADINYSDKSGQLRTYAVSDDKSKTGRGTNESFVLNGSIDFGKGTAGPSIYCYLNSSSFTNGDKINATPYFVAELYDDDGINSTGSGIGHSMQLIIDGDMSRTYELNNHFTFDFGTYKSGRVGFSIPRLPEGEHHLLFRAWDVFNNPSTAELTFNVVDGLAPMYFDVESTKNPAVDNTSFRIIHDRINCELSVTLDVFDMSGRHLWTHTEKDSPTDNTMIINWDLTVNGGSRLGTGVYLYRVRISCEGGSYVSKAKKLIVISNK